MFMVLIRIFVFLISTQIISFYAEIQCQGIFPLIIIKIHVLSNTHLHFVSLLLSEPGKAVIRIKVPKGMITSGTSDKDLSGMVGRLLDQELKAQKSKSGWCLIDS